MATSQRNPNSAPALDPVSLTSELLRFKSVTPTDGGCTAHCRQILTDMGFSVEIFESGSGDNVVHNLIGRYGTGEPVLCFAGHTDVVPTGPQAHWSHPPFSGITTDGHVWGRGAVDMKGAIAAFFAAAQRYIQEPKSNIGSIMVLLTGDEEVGSESGMRAILSRVQNRYPAPEVCLIGEPSCEGYFGQGIRIGRRGSLNVAVEAIGVQGHVAWPDRAQNALHALLDFLRAARDIDFGPAESCFPATNLEITQVKSDSDVSNVIPGRATAHFNIRFNRQHAGRGLIERLESAARSFDKAKITLTPSISGEPYLAENCPLADIIADASFQVTGKRPQMNAGGGVSDGRFVRHWCPVVEFGLVGDLAHKVDERVEITDIRRLTDIYHIALRNFFNRN